MAWVPKSRSRRLTGWILRLTRAAREDWQTAILPRLMSGRLTAPRPRSKASVIPSSRRLLTAAGSVMSRLWAKAKRARSRCPSKIVLTGELLSRLRRSTIARRVDPPLRHATGSPSAHVCRGAARHWNGRCLDGSPGDSGKECGIRVKTNRRPSARLRGYSAFRDSCWSSSGKLSPSARPVAWESEAFSRYS